jgi:two-component system sensor histidine kinase BaeS
MDPRQPVKSRFSRHRPPWWPENEAWPPSAPPWRRSHWDRSRGRLFRRIGCLFVLFNLLVASLVLLFFGWLAQVLGVIRLPASFGNLLPWFFLLGFLLFLSGFAFLIWAGRGLRHLSAPLGDLLEASEQVAQGDYAVRVAESGPAEVRSLARAFNSMAARLQVTDEQRRSLLADVTHELRTPLTVIQGNLEGMLDGVYPPDPAHLAALLEETQLLARLVDDLRTLALAESGALRLKKEPVDLAVLVHETAAGFRPQADARQVDLAVEGSGDPPLLSLDPERMRQVLHNLLANALRYTPPGGTIRLRYEVLAPDRQALISLQDSGSGISPDDLPYIFDRFYKTRDSTGMGLGLPIAKKLVEAHGGTITAQSLVGQGTLVQIRLPV